jgi:hypothetical protein
MKPCPYCGNANHPEAVQCRRCENFLVSAGGTVYCPAKRLLIGPGRTHDIRSKALAAVALGLLIKVYWGGYGPWPVIDDPTLASFRQLLEPCVFYGGTVGYVVGWLLRWI